MKKEILILLVLIFVLTSGENILKTDLISIKMHKSHERNL